MAGVKTVLFLFVIIVVSCVSLPQAHASLVTYHSMDSILLDTAFISGSEDFELASLVGSTASGGVEALSFDDLSVAADLPALKVLNAPAYGNHNTTPGGFQYLSIDTDIAFTGSTMTMTFSDSILVFGVTLIDLERIGGTGTISINGQSFNVIENGDGGESFFGVISDTPFTTVTFDMGVDSHWSLDDLVYDWEVQTVPEPSSLLILGAGLVGIVLGRRRFSC